MKFQKELYWFESKMHSNYGDIKSRIFAFVFVYIDAGCTHTKKKLK